jgi:threonine/homoserine/homoserine lactone efflux protein
MPLPHDLLLALTLYAFVSSITPGPNNLMLLASGVNFGFRRTILHMLGIGGGFTVMVAIVGFGLAGLFLAYPPARLVLTVLSVLYLLWLAWKIATAAPPNQDAPAAGKPFGFFQAAAFQWVNPKAWTMALTANTLYAPNADWPSVLTVALAFGAVNLPSVSVWAAMGTMMRGFLRDPKRLRIFNGVMAALLVATLWPVLMT